MARRVVVPSRRSQKCTEEGEKRERERKKNGRGEKEFGFFQILARNRVNHFSINYGDYREMIRIRQTDRCLINLSGTVVYRRRVAGAK